MGLVYWWSPGVIFGEKKKCRLKIDLNISIDSATDSRLAWYLFFLTYLYAGTHKTGYEWVCLTTAFFNNISSKKRCEGVNPFLV